MQCIRIWILCGKREKLSVRVDWVGFPTETVYGLGADALLPEGAKRIYAAKGRPSDNPLIVHIADFEALKKITSYIPPQAKALADAFWPGPLTMIFQKSDAVPYETTGGLDTVAVRMPSHPTAAGSDPGRRAVISLRRARYF